MADVGVWVRYVCQLYTSFWVVAGGMKTRPGFVLISVLMLGVLLISCATAFSWFARMQVRSVVQGRMTLTHRSMAQLMTEAVIGLIVEASDRANADNPRQRWFRPFLFPVDDLGIWAVQVTPLDDKFPIRNLFLPDGNTLRGELKAPWEDLWSALNHRELAVPVLDFLDKNDKARVGGVEREAFINRAPLDISELLLMEEVTPEILYGEEGNPGLADLSTVWSDGKINLNVAPPEVLALLPGLGSGQANWIVQYRKENNLRNLSDLQSIPGLTPRTSTQLTNLAAFKSRYFSIRIELLDASDSPGGTSYQIIFDRTTKKVVHWEES